MPLRSVKMNRFIFGFQRRVWCPKWTPLSSSCFMLTAAMPCRPSVLRAPRGLPSSVDAAPGGDRPGVLQHHTSGGCPPGPRWRLPRRAAGRRTREVDPSQTDRTTSIPAPRRAPPRAIRPSTGGHRGLLPSGPRPRVDGVRARLLLVAVLVPALLAPVPAVAEASPAVPAAAWGWPLNGTPAVTRAFEPPAG